MSKKQMMTLGVFAGLLALVFLIQKLIEPKPDLEQEYKLAALAPEGFLASDVARLEIYRGSKKDDKVRLVRDEDGWTVESAFKAPGKKDKIEEFLKKIKGLEGELRSDDASVLGDFDITDEKALHVVAFKKGEDGAWGHLLVGKEEDHSRSFVRREGEEAVYVINVNLASEAGISTSSDDEDGAPESSHWVDKTVVDLEKGKIDRIAIVTPDRKVVFERREKEAEADEKEDKDKKKEHEWVLAEGGAGLEFKQSGIDSLLVTLDSFVARDVVDPSKKKELGLDEPGFRLAVGLEGGKETVLLAAREKPDKDGYVTVEGRAVVYKVDYWRFDDLFPKGNDLFEFKGLDEDKDKIERITLDYPSGRIELVRKDDKWAISSPETGLEFKESEAEDVARALADWTPKDYAEGEDMGVFGLAGPERRATFTVEGGKSHTIAFGAEGRVVEGRYALVDGGELVLVLGKWDYESMCPEPKKFFDMKVADVDEDDLAKVVIQREGAALTLERKGDDWKLIAGGTEIGPDEDGVKDYLGRFSPVEAEDIDLAGEATRKPEITVKVEGKDKKGFVIRFGPAKDGKRAASVEGRNAGLVFEADKAGQLAPSLKDLADLTVVDRAESDIIKIVVERDEDPFEIVKEGEAWKVALGGEKGEKKDCNAEAVSGYLDAFPGLEAEDVVAGRTDLVPDDARPVVTITRKDESAFTLVIGKEHDGKIALRRKDRPLVFLVGKDEASSLTPAAEDLVAPEEGKKE